MTMKRPKVGVGVAIRDSDCVLLGLRKSPHATGMWGFPGGHLEGGESFEDCALRETQEEAGIMLVGAKLWTVVNTIFWNEKQHFVNILMVADMPLGQTPRVMEPDKCEKWGWFRWTALPSPLMPGIESAFQRGLTPIGL